MALFISAVTYRDNNTVHLILAVKGVIVLPKSITPVRIMSNFTGAFAARTSY